MKITINLTESEVKGIKKYLKDVCEIEHPTKEDITNFINNIVNNIHSDKESVSDYIKLYE